MKATSALFILSITITFLFTGCGEQVTEINRKFVGIWNNTSSSGNCRLSIDNGSNGYWHGNNGATAMGVARIKHDKLFIGLKQFNIFQYPMQDSAGVWTINLSGNVYQRQ